ncbi:MAG: hypothetical protein Fur0040_11620 [Sideroxydans sp.]
MRNIWIVLVVLAVLAGCAQGGSPAGASERRTAGTVLDDQDIERKAQQRIADKFAATVQVNVTCFNRYALITGQVPNETAKMEIERIVGGIPPVKGIANELQVVAKPVIGPDHDGAISNDVRSRFGGSKAFNRDHIKVYTQNGVVYLMGIVTHAEADAASEIASTTNGVQKVVRVFEYMD